MHRRQNPLLRYTTHCLDGARPTDDQRTLLERAPPAIRFYRRLLALVLLCGALFYLVYRSNAWHWALERLLSGIGSEAITVVSIPALPSTLYQSFPSLIGGVSVVLFITLLRPANLGIWRNVLTVSIATLLVFEYALGYFHWLDVVAILMGVLCGLGLVALRVRHDRNRLGVASTVGEHLSRAADAGFTSLRYSLIPAMAAMLFSSLLAIGSTWTDGTGNECARYSEAGFCEEYKRQAQPVYISYATLRDAVKVESARPPDRIGRLYLYGNFVFLNEVNEGIHIIDNTEPTSPVNLAFIRIPGNTEIAIRDNYLYADSYIDLITLDINDPQNVSVIGREQSIFPYNEFQNIPQNISFSDTEIDRQQGVVVSYRLAGS